MAKCKVCDQESPVIFQKTILQKYHSDYYRCKNCGFIQTSEPVWLEEAYQSAITSLDIGLIDRNLYLNEQVPRIVETAFPDNKAMLDYGGGYGMLVRMLRDKGYNFYRQDLYCENLFAKHFDIQDAPVKRFDLLSAFEVFEHLTDPLPEISKMFKLSDSIVFSTLLVPSENVKELEDWWYLSTLTGQHVALYSFKSLELIAKKFGKNFYSNGNNLHLMTSKLLSEEQQRAMFGVKKKRGIINRIINRLNKDNSTIQPRPSLLPKDYAFIENLLKQNSKL